MTDINFILTWLDYVNIIEMYNIPTKKEFPSSIILPKSYAIDFNSLINSPSKQIDVLFEKAYSSKGVPIKFKYEYKNTQPSS